MAKATIPISVKEFDKLWPKIAEKLDEFLDDEQEPFEEDAEGAEASGVWGGIPAIDSKTLAKAAPVIEEVLGSSFDAKWIKPGGYENRTEMKEHLKATMRENCKTTSSKAKAVAITGLAARAKKK